jgi:DNA-binding NarL/FixJ family response regulator
MRDFALERMVAEGDAVRTRSAHAAHFTEQAALGLEAPERAMLDRLEREIGNYRAALEYTRSTLSPNLATLALRLKPLWLGVLGPAEGRLWLEAALSVSPEDARTPIWLRQCLTAVAAAGGDMAAARSYSLEGLALSQELGDPRLHCEMLDCMASVEVCSDVPAALAYAEKGLEIARTLDHPLTLVTTYGMVIDVLREAGESDRAASLLEEAVATMGRIEEPVTRSRVELMAREQLAEEQVRFGDAEARLRFQREMLEWGEYDFPHLATLSRVAALLVNAGRPLRAVRLAGAIDEACKRRGFDTGVLWGSDDREVLDDALRAMGPRGRAIYDAGRDMSMDETRTYALDDAQDDALSGVHLTRREREVADLVRQGLTDPQIARLLHLSPRTVEGHVENLRGKLGVNTRAGVAAWAAVSLP